MATYRTLGVFVMMVLLVLLEPCQGQSAEAKCMTDIAACTGGLAGMADDEGAAITVAGFQQSCMLMVNASECVNSKLDGNCKGSDLGKTTIKYLEFGLSACNALTAKRQCYAALECFESHMGSDSDMSCSDMEMFLDCLHEKSMQDGCTIDESKMSFAAVKNITAGMCSMQQSCAQADDCIQLEIPDMSNMNMENIGNLAPITVDFTSPGFYCRLMQTATKCYMDSADACNFDEGYKTALMEKHDELKKKCPEEPSAGRTLVPEMLGLAAMILVSIWSVL